MDLALVWAGIIAFGVTMYVLLDGFSLSIGILFPFALDATAKDKMMASVTPVWDGNQTWLVLGGASLFAAFPKAFNLLLTILYLPLIIMLIALVLRGVAFEFRFQTDRRTGWDNVFGFGSTLAGFCQGIVLGTYVRGFDFQGGVYQGTAFDWFNPFSLMTGIAVVCAYALLGACWLVIKTEGHLQTWARHQARRLLWIVVAFIALVSVWTPIAERAIALRWFAWPNLLFLSPIPVLTGVVALALHRSLRQASDHQPFFLCVGLYVLTLSGLAISLWPYIVPRSLTIWQVASPPQTQMFLLVGVVFIIPLVLAYTAHSYYVFRGKVTLEDVYD